MAWKNSRKIHIDGQEWEWKVSKSRCWGRTIWVCVRGPDGVARDIRFERGDQIKPSAVKQHIEENFLEK